MLFAGGMLREDIGQGWEENRLLASLPERDRSRLIPQLEILTLFAKETVYESGEEMNFVYFPLDCIVVLISSVESKDTVEVGLIGYEGMVGAPILLGAKHSTSQALILVEGKALRLPAALLRKEAKRSGRMRELMLTYANALLAQSAQLAACHRYHTPQARLARLLLMIQDRMKTLELRITQDMLAHLLGTRRATVTEAANQLQDNGLIGSVRGKIGFLDRKGLEAKACSCYAIITAQQQLISAQHRSRFQTS
ncbi:MAG TPA: Crp/Fnr family transcriptional regulator [Pyrinomonadaceae bacterium]|nr:Crp/Fnr family transcriptional regulator [Pyrinomonadaceae bacterium]